MLRWFRQYNKYFIAIGMTLLMVVFLIEGVVPRLAQSGDPVIGHIGSRKVYLSQRIGAENELKLIGRLSYELGLLTVRDPMEWLLSLEDAQKMGISAGPSQVNQLLRAIMPEGQRDVEQLSEQIGANPLEVDEVLEHWIIFQQYRELVSGMSHVPVLQRYYALQLALNARNQKEQSAYLMMMQGQPRVSIPLLERYIQDQNATVTVRAVAVTPEAEMRNLPMPDDQAIQKLYDQYKDDFPGGDKGYGLGYKLPDRVKIEYIKVPFDDLLKKVTVEEDEAYRFYEQHKDQMTTTLSPPESTPEAAPATQPGAKTRPASRPAPTTQPGKPRVMGYMEVRDQIFERLRYDKARALSDQIVKEIQAMLIENAHGLPEEEGYRKLPANWKPLGFEDIARREFENDDRFKVMLSVYSVQNRWLDKSALDNLPGLGTAFLRTDQSTPASDYIMSVHELKPNKNNPLLPLHLQVGLPSLPVEGYTGDRFIFRVTAANPEHVPPLAEIHDQVLRDALRVAGYERLKADRIAWEQKARSTPLSTLAASLHTMVISPLPFQRRKADANGVLATPDLAGIGVSQAFVDAAFKLAESSAAAQTQPAPSAQADMRADAVPIDSRLTLYLIRVENYQPITRGEFEQKLRDSQVLGTIESSLAGAPEASPMSLDALAKRVGYVQESGSKDSSDAPAGEPPADD